MGLFSRKCDESEDESGSTPAWDTVGDNPTGRPRKSSAGKRRQKDRKLFEGTPWARDDSEGDNDA